MEAKNRKVDAKSSAAGAKSSAAGAKNILPPTSNEKEAEGFMHCLKYV